MFISTLLCLIKLKFGMPLRYALCRIVLEFHKNHISDDVKVTSFTILQTNVHISNSTKSTNIQQHKIHQMIKAQVALTKAEGHR